MALHSKPTARVMAIIDLLTANPDKAFGLTTITRKLSLNKATCHAILSTMTDYGYLVQDKRSRAYRLGPSIVAAGHAAFAQFPVLEYSRPELEQLTAALGLGCGATAITGEDIVLLAHYGASDPFHSPFQLGMRLPNRAPLGACFIAWSPAEQLEKWLRSAQLDADSYDERLDRQLRMSVIAIRARGYEVTLKTKAEETLISSLGTIEGTWDLEALATITETFRQNLLQEHYHLDRFDADARYPVCNIAVPVFATRGNEAQLCFSTGSIERELSGRDIQEIATALRGAAQRVSEAATLAFMRRSDR